MSKTKLREKFKKIIQDSHDCAEWGCWDNHDVSIDLLEALFQQIVREVIGENEQGSNRFFEGIKLDHHSFIVGKNSLRIEQRARLKDIIGGEK